MTRNYQKELDQKLTQITAEGRVPTLLLHSCCAPCSSYVLEYLSQYFAITILYYNPNIAPPEEYFRRAEEQKNFLTALKTAHPVRLVEGVYEPADFYAAVKGLENEPEGGERCFKCYALRLEEAAKAAKTGGFDYFTTTLTISPHKNAEKLNEIGERLGEACGIPFLNADFKKKNGFKRSLELSAQYGLYRQDYCGCIFSKQIKSGI